MMKLKNVKKEGSWISADYFPEDWEEFGSVAVNADNPEERKIKMSPKDEAEYGGYPYAVQAMNALLDMAEGDRDIRDCTLAWY